MSKSLEKKFIRGWRVALAKYADSKHCAWWRGKSISNESRQMGLLSARCAIYHRAQRNAFSVNRESSMEYFAENYDRLLVEARKELDAENIDFQLHAQNIIGIWGATDGNDR